MSLSPKQLEAVELVGRKMANDKVAAQVSVGARTLDRWKAEPEFQAAVEEWRNAWRARVRETGIADQDRRLFRLNDRYRRMQAVIEARAKDPSMQHVSGGNTGLLVPTAFGYKVETALLSAMLAHEEQAAIELGQWKREESASKQIIIVMPQGTAPSSAHVLEVPPEEAPLAIPGVVIDLVPQR